MIIFMKVLAGLLFILSSGLLFNERFKANHVLVALAGLIGVLSSVFLANELASLAGGIERHLSTDRIVFVLTSCVGTAFFSVLVWMAWREHKRS